MIPQDKQAAIRKALETTFEVDEFEDIQPLTKGLPARRFLRSASMERLTCYV
jgi:hypothetical protein